jgi:hypothetical protein
MRRRLRLAFATAAAVSGLVFMGLSSSAEARGRGGFHGVTGGFHAGAGGFRGYGTPALRYARPGYRGYFRGAYPFYGGFGWGYPYYGDCYQWIAGYGLMNICSGNSYW